MPLTQVNSTVLGTLGNLTVTGNVNIAGNISASRYIGGSVNVTGNILVGNIISSSATVNGIANVNMLNASGNILATGLSVFGNTRIGSLTVPGALHTIIGNVDVSGAGTEYFNIGGNIMAIQGSFGSIDSTGNISASVANFGNGNVAGFAIGYRDLPQVTAGNVTLALTDASKHYYSSTNTPYTITVPSNANVAFTTGTTIVIINKSTSNISIAKQSAVSLYTAGNVTNTTRTLTSYGMATLVKTESDVWFINGTGLV